MHCTQCATAVVKALIITCHILRCCADVIGEVRWVHCTADATPVYLLPRYHTHALPHAIRMLFVTPRYCHSQVYYMLAHARKSRRISDIGLVRIEQLAPLVADQLAAVINAHSRAELVWVQVRERRG